MGPPTSQDGRGSLTHPPPGSLKKICVGNFFPAFCAKGDFRGIFSFDHLSLTSCKKCDPESFIIFNFSGDLDHFESGLNSHKKIHQRFALEAIFFAAGG